MDNHTEGHVEKKDGDIETRKFFLNCMCLLLGRFDSKKFEKTVSEYGVQLSHVLLSQLQSADEGLVAGAVFLFKAAIVKPSYASASSVESGQMYVVFPLLLQLLDEGDGTARAVVVLIAEYCSMSTDRHCLQQVLKRLASGNLLQRQNAIDVISELVCISSDSENKVSHVTWQDIVNNLLERLSDEEVVIREQASKLLSRMDPSLFLSALLDLVYSSDDEGQSSASSALIEMLKYHNQKPEVICLLLDCLSNVNQSLDTPNTTRDVREGPKKDDRVLKLISEWSKSVQDWKLFVGPLIEKMFSEPTNATIVRFLSSISEPLADVADAVLNHILLQMQGQEDSVHPNMRTDASLLSRRQIERCAPENLVEIQQCLFERLCPLLIIRLLPLRVFDDLKSAVVYGQLPNEGITYECRDVNTRGQACIAAFLLKRAISKSEFEDVRKLAAELCGRLHPHVLFPVVSTLLEHAADCREVLQVKACLFSVCTSLLVRGKESISHPAILQIKKTIETILLWPSLDGDEGRHYRTFVIPLLLCTFISCKFDFLPQFPKRSMAALTVWH
uniref:Uncharacterized protein LOC105645187 n=1 Tax=Rhizophora mucronata TaxID=61149 RepID=A0A2P2L6A8_RHIMU